MQYRTDLAVERAREWEGAAGVRTRSARVGCLTRSEVDIDSQEAADRLQKPCGRYITYETPPVHSLAQADRQALSREIADTLRGVSALAPGVLGVTGMETADMVLGAVRQTHPAAVVAVDALSARECARIGTAIQITDTGIQPGSGVGNHRAGLPVIALGVPTVVYSTVIVRDALAQLLDTLPDAPEDRDAAADSLARRLTRRQIGEMVVTPREIDQMVGELSQVLAMGLNLALQPRLSPEEIAGLMNETM